MRHQPFFITSKIFQKRPRTFIALIFLLCSWPISSCSAEGIDPDKRDPNAQQQVPTVEESVEKNVSQFSQNQNAINIQNTINLSKGNADLNPNPIRSSEKNHQSKNDGQKINPTIVGAWIGGLAVIIAALIQLIPALKNLKKRQDQPQKAENGSKEIIAPSQKEESNFEPSSAEELDNSDRVFT